MVGNDVVDLADAEAQGAARHPRFDVRVFAPDERRRIAAADSEAPLRWILWTAKEAAYKLARRRDPACIFSPIRFVVALDTAPDTKRGATLEGHVRHADEAYPVRVTLDGDCVHAVVTAPGRSFARVAASSHRLGDTDLGAEPSQAVRDFAIFELAPLLGADAASLSIRSRERIPRLQLHAGQTADLSLSHHGRFVAYACALPEPHSETPQ
jgi:phosphopantetheinyl transferase (holo-ACP synthase)